ncbi:MAG: hypothetical protein ABGZ35_06375 [Planctomycetaceae bacterium]
MNDFSLFWSIIVPGAVLILTIMATTKVYRDVTDPPPTNQPEDKA